MFKNWREKRAEEIREEVSNQHGWLSRRYDDLWRNWEYLIQASFRMNSDELQPDLDELRESVRKTRETIAAAPVSRLTYDEIKEDYEDLKGVMEKFHKFDADQGDWRQSDNAAELRKYGWEQYAASAGMIRRWAQLQEAVKSPSYLAETKARAHAKDQKLIKEREEAQAWRRANEERQKRADLLLEQLPEMARKGVKAGRERHPEDRARALEAAQRLVLEPFLKIYGTRGDTPSKILNRIEHACSQLFPEPTPRTAPRPPERKAVQAQSVDPSPPPKSPEPKPVQAQPVPPSKPPEPERPEPRSSGPSLGM